MLKGTEQVDPALTIEQFHFHYRLINVWSFLWLWKQTSLWYSFIIFPQFSEQQSKIRALNLHTLSGKNTFAASCVLLFHYFSSCVIHFCTSPQVLFSLRVCCLLFEELPGGDCSRCCLTFDNQASYIATEKSNIPPGFVSFCGVKVWSCSCLSFQKQNFAGTPPLSQEIVFQKYQTSREFYLYSYTKIHGCLFKKWSVSNWKPIEHPCLGESEMCHERFSPHIIVTKVRAQYQGKLPTYQRRSILLRLTYTGHRHWILWNPEW